MKLNRISYALIVALAGTVAPVSYTHLDVYKRQVLALLSSSMANTWPRRNIVSPGCACTTSACAVALAAPSFSAWSGPSVAQAASAAAQTKPTNSVIRVFKAVSYTHIDVYKRQR